MRTDFSKFDKPEERPKDARAIMAELRDLVLRVDFVSLVHPEAGSIKERMGSVTDDAERDTLKKRLAKLKVTERQKYVVIVDELLRLAEANNYGLAKNGAFVYLYNGRYWEEIEKDLLTDYLGEIAERMGVKRYDARQFQEREPDETVPLQQFSVITGSGGWNKDKPNERHLRYRGENRVERAQAGRLLEIPTTVQIRSYGRLPVIS